jgi:hypothetical protein
VKQFCSSRCAIQSCSACQSHNTSPRSTWRSGSSRRQQQKSSTAHEGFCTCSSRPHPVGVRFFASALIDSFNVPMGSIVTVLDEWLPSQTVAYFCNTHGAWDRMVLDVLQHIVRPARFDSTVDAILHPSYDFFLEMKALGIPTFLQVLQDLQPGIAAQMSVQASADITAAVRSYMGRF